jgi:hypothetical protein
MQTQLAEAIGQTIRSAHSSLDSFALEFDNDRVLLARAVLTDGDESEPAIELSMVSSDSISQLADAVCAVDWSWLSGSKVESVDSVRARLTLRLNPVGPLHVSVAMWQGAPFLAFQPFRPPK